MFSRESFFVPITLFFTGIKVREYIRREHIKPVLRFLMRIGIVVGVILLLDAIGLCFFLFSQGLWNLPRREGKGLPDRGDREPGGIQGKDRGIERGDGGYGPGEFSGHGGT